MADTHTGLPPASAYHRRPFRLANSVLRGLNKLGVARATLQESALLDIARKKTGLSDFGDESFLVPMRVLLNSLEEEAELHPLGRFLANQSIVRILKHRLLLEDLLKREPQILDREIAPPVAIVGLARSGTTRLHRLLGSDRRFLTVKSWETVNPVPWPESYTAAVDPRMTSIEQALKAVLYLSPQMAAVHPLDAHEVEEEVGLLQHGFATQLWEVCGKVPSFAEYIMNHDQIAAYEYMVKLMKVISWFRNDPADATWILKSPQHMQDLDALYRVFPDARFIFPHRDPVKVMGSTCSMAWNGIVRDTDEVSPHWLGNEWMTKTEHMLNKTQRIRDNDIPKAQQYDVLYADITRDWQQALGGIYDFIGVDLDATALAGMQAWLDANNQHKHGTHKYSLADFGLDKDDVERRLAFYRQRFNIPHETRNPHLAKSANT